MIVKISYKQKDLDTSLSSELLLIWDYHLGAIYFFSSHRACQSVDLHFSFSAPEEINEDFYSGIPKGFSLISFIARPILCQALYTTCFIRFL